MNDPLGDMIARIYNAQMRNKSKVSIPASRLRVSVLDVLKAEGFIRGYAAVDSKRLVPTELGTLVNGLLVDHFPNVVDAERHCCRFLRFAMTVEPDGGPVFLELTGPAGTRDFVSALIEGRLPTSSSSRSRRFSKSRVASRSGCRFAVARRPWWLCSVW